MESEDLDASCLSTIGYNNDSSWNATIQINGQSVVKLFTGLGTFKGDFEITKQPEVMPFAIHTPRRVPIPLHQ